MATHAESSAVDTRFWLTTAATVALIATTGSLWFSEGMGLYPCDLCWYQRILMYPLVVVLGVAAIENRPKVWRTVLPLSVLGIGVAAYHSWVQATKDACTFQGPCATVQWEGPVVGLTIPNLSLIAFVLVTLAVLVGSGLLSGLNQFADSDGVPEEN